MASTPQRPRVHERGSSAHTIPSTHPPPGLRTFNFALECYLDTPSADSRLVLMLARKLSSLRIARCPGDDCLRPRVYGSVLRLRRSPVASYVTISDPQNPRVPQNISLAHPKDPSNLNQPSPSQSAFPPSPSQTSAPEPPPSDGGSKPGDNAETTPSSDENASLPVKFVHPTIDPQTNLPFPHAGPASPPLHINPPFNTHRFFTVLERSFPTPIARNLMRATRALLVDRIGRVKRDALTTQDLESVSRVPIYRSMLARA